jgi:hypothetical protein
MDQIAAINSRRPRFSSGGLISALLMAVLPKCPLCFMAYVGVIGIFGIDPFLYRWWLLPFTSALAAFTLTVLFFQARRNSRYLAFCVSLFTIAALLLGKFYLNSDPVFYAALVLLLVSAAWVSIPKRSLPENSRCLC